MENCIVTGQIQEQPPVANPNAILTVTQVENKLMAH